MTTCIIGQFIVDGGNGGVTNKVIEQNSANRFSGSKTSGSTSDTISVTVDSTGGNRILIVVTSGDDEPTGITYNGTSLTKQNSIGSSGIYATAWYLVNPDTGTHDLVVTAASLPDITYSGTTFLNVNQATPTSGNSSSSGGPATSHSVGRDTTTTDMLVTSSGCGANQTGAGGSQVEFGDTGPLFGIYGAGAYQQGVGGVTTNSYTHSSQIYTIIGFELFHDAP